MNCEESGGPAVRAYRSCGCTDDRACMTEEGPCRWIEADLCSACAEADKPSAVIRGAVLKALPTSPPGMRPAETWRAIGGWSVGSVRNALRWLVDDGFVAYHGEDGNRRYWRGSGDSPPPAVRHEVVGVRPLVRGETSHRETTIAGYADPDEAIAAALAIDMAGWYDIFVRPVARPASAMSAALREAAE